MPAAAGDGQAQLAGTQAAKTTGAEVTDLPLEGGQVAPSSPKAPWAVSPSSSECILAIPPWLWLMGRV